MPAVKPKRYREHRWLGVAVVALPDTEETDRWVAPIPAGEHLCVDQADLASPRRAYCLDCEAPYEVAPEACRAPAREVAYTNGQDHG